MQGARVEAISPLPCFTAPASSHLHDPPPPPSTPSLRLDTRRPRSPQSVQRSDRSPSPGVECLRPHPANSTGPSTLSPSARRHSTSRALTQRFPAICRRNYSLCTSRRQSVNSAPAPTFSILDLLHPLPSLPFPPPSPPKWSANRAPRRSGSVVSPTSARPAPRALRPPSAPADHPSRAPATSSRSRRAPSRRCRRCTPAPPPRPPVRRARPPPARPRRRRRAGAPHAPRAWPPPPPTTAT